MFYFALVFLIFAVAKRVPDLQNQQASLRHRVVSPSGELLVRNVSSADDGVSYRCQTRHKLTGSVKESDTSGRIIVNLSTGPFQPRHIFTRSALSVDEGSTAELVCVAHGYSVPEYSKITNVLRFQVLVGCRR
ncbi:hypothetical protein HPB51_020718 [Rhipicephalus microplus]|uniref:Ig-like domain-containing protein n=1 Tax=Rhipicephalus microplus TaxID=6941 RepID=A0A9J6DPZ5_RHIMP|nr:hypothetical protein HPB51_020718 [Rhipicephalus microplus]